VTSRNIGDPISIVNTLEGRIGMIVHPWKDVQRVVDHPKIFVSKGTHSNYLAPGPHSLSPFTPGGIDLNQGTCAQIEKLDDVIPGGEGYPGRKGDPTLLVLLILLFPFLYPAIGEAYAPRFGRSPDTPNPKPQDETGGPLFGLILKPIGVSIDEEKFAKVTEEWKTQAPKKTDNPHYDFIVDRGNQLWWPPRDNSKGYAGRWGPCVTNDPKARRSGMRCPPFALMLLQAIARL
jgi:hypothetical protein